MRGGTHMFAIRKDRVSFTGLAKGASVLALGFATSAVAQTTTTQDPAASTPREARDRKSVVEGKSVSVRVDLGGRRIIKKKHDVNKKHMLIMQQSRTVIHTTQQRR